MLVKIGANGEPIAAGTLSSQSLLAGGNWFQTQGGCQPHQVSILQQAFMDVTNLFSASEGTSGADPSSLRFFGSGWTRDKDPSLNRQDDGRCYCSKLGGQRQGDWSIPEYDYESYRILRCSEQAGTAREKGIGGSGFCSCLCLFCCTMMLYRVMN